MRNQIEMRHLPRPALALAGSALILLGACSQPLDFDLRGAFGDAPSTADAARNATAKRPEPDSRGIISYPNYQVAVARRGDTLNTLATRIGADVNALSAYNGIEPSDNLRKGEIIALPSRVAEPEGGPIRPGGVDITALAGTAIDEADAAQIETTTLDPTPARPTARKAQSGIEPVRHKVERGETAYSIARLYKVSIRSLAEWNGLGSDFAVREGQFLLIPVVLPQSSDNSDAILPGDGSPTPEPPSASTPLPEDDTTAASETITETVAPDLSQPETSSSARMGYPVKGDIIREYSKGKNDGIDIAAAPGTPIRAAADGTVAAITEDTNGAPIIVLKHDGNLLTVYSNVGGVTVTKGDRVKRGAKLAEIRKTGTAAVHFEVRDGFDSVDPLPYLN